MAARAKPLTQPVLMSLAPGAGVRPGSVDDGDGPARQDPSCDREGRETEQAATWAGGEAADDMDAGRLDTGKRLGEDLGDGRLNVRLHQLGKWGRTASRRWPTRPISLPPASPARVPERR